MSGYQAQIDDLRSSAKAANSAGEQVSGIDLAGALGAAAEAMPGARCAQSFKTLENAWRGDVSGWASQASGYADALIAAADRYASNEDAAAREFSTSRGGGRPV